MIKNYPNVKQSFGLFGLYIIISILLGLGVFSLSDYMPQSLLTLVATIITLTITIAIALNLKRAGISYLFSRPGAASAMAYGVGALFTVFLIFVMDPLTSAIPMPEGFKKLFEGLFNRDLFTFLSIAVAAPILEELLFRKIMLEGLERNYGSYKAIIWSAVLFAIFHFNPWQGIGAFFIGLFLGWLYVKTRDIWLCIFIHFFNNSLAFIAFIVSDDPFYSVVDMAEGNSYSLAAIIAISLIALYFCYRILKRHFELKGKHLPVQEGDEKSGPL